MFENEDLFVDEDFLNDLDEASQLYYSQIENTEDIITATKRRKLHHGNASAVKTTGKPSTSMATQLISPSSSTINSYSHYVNPTRPTTKPLSSSTKKLALELMENKYLKEEQNNMKSLTTSRSATSSSDDEQKTVDNTQHYIQTMSNTDIFSPEPFKTPLRYQPKTLVRKFPGPAGLIPDGLKGTFKDLLKDPLKDKLVDDAFYCLQNLNDDETSVSKPSDTSRMSEFCSQETKKLFSDGAWRRMLDDLPKNFLRGYDITSIKRPGVPKKIPILAGVIHSIQLDNENPRITLKDISNSVEAVMHKDISTKYPNILQLGVVVLLRDIGVLNFQGAQKYSTMSLVMIPSNSILAAYSKKERLVTTPALNKILNRDYDIESTKMIKNTSENSATALELESNNYSRFKRDKSKLHVKAKPNCKFVQWDLENINPIENFDDMSDLDFDEPTAVFSRNSIENSTISSDNHGGEQIITRAFIEVQPNQSCVRDNNLSLSRVPTMTNNDPTDPTEIINLSEATTISATTSFADDLFNDTDDEILSQFDIDSITNHHKDT